MAGENAKYIINSNEAYAIEDVKVDGKSIGVVSSYEFTKVKANHSISATSKKIESTSNDFTDVAVSSWYNEPVMMTCDKGWFNGTSATSFSPNTVMTRGMFVTVLWRSCYHADELFRKIKFQLF